LQKFLTNNNNFSEKNLVSQSFSISFSKNDIFGKEKKGTKNFWIE